MQNPDTHSLKSKKLPIYIYIYIHTYVTQIAYTYVTQIAYITYVTQITYITHIVFDAFTSHSNGTWLIHIRDIHNIRYTNNLHNIYSFRCKILTHTLSSRFPHREICMYIHTYIKYMYRSSFWLEKVCQDFFKWALYICKRGLCMIFNHLDTVAKTHRIP